MSSNAKWDQLPTLTAEQVYAEYGPTLETPLKLDPRVLKGVLPNGATYYVRPNAEPQQRAELRVLLKVGSVLEAEHERGIAHVIEHLAFRGSKSSEANFQLIKELEAYGVQFGAHQNAVTGFDSTCYELHVPTDNPELLQKAFHILQSLALEARLSDEDLDAERKIVIEEWRQSRSGGMRASEHFTKLLLQGSLYADRFPIGLMEVIEQVTGETLRSFYRRYYCPSNCCVAAVGDFDDPEAIVELIKDTFGSAVNDPAVVPLPPLPAVPPHPSLRVGVYWDPEVSSASLSIECKRLEAPVTGTAKELRENIMHEMFHMALTNRLEKLAYKADPPFISARSNGNVSITVAGLGGASLQATAPESRVLMALHCLLTEVERVRKEGFSAKELENVRNNIRSDLLADHIERDQIPSQDYCEDLLELFQYNVALMDVEDEVMLTHYLLDVITDSEILATASHFKWDENCVIHITMPTPKLGHRISRFLRRDKKDAEPVTEEAVKHIVALVKAGHDPQDTSTADHSGSSEDPVAVLELPAMTTPPGRIAQCREFESSEITELVLSNGMRVAYKCTRFQDDEVQMSGMAWGGLSEFYGSKELARQYASARWGDTLAAEFGIGGIPPSEISELLAGMRVSLSTRTDSYNRTFGGHCSPQDLETALHLVHLLFTVPITINKKRLDTVIQRTKDRLANAGKNPHAAFGALVDRLNTCDHPYFRPFALQDLKGLNAQAALDYFHQCYSDPAHFTLILVGNLSVSTLHPLLETYVASIPRPQPPLPCLSRTTVTPLDVHFPPTPATGTLPLLLEEGCSVKITLPVTIGDPHTGTHEMRLRDSIALGLCLDVMERRLLEVLRFELGSVYTVNVSLSFVISNPTLRPTDLGHGECFISTACPPDKADFLTQRIFEEVKKLLTDGPKSEEVTTAVEADRRAFESSQRTNGWWLGRIQDGYQQVRYAGDIEAMVESDMALCKEVRESLSVTAVRDLLARCLSTSTHTVAVLKPQSRTWLWAKRHALALVLGTGTLSAAVLLSIYLMRQRALGRKR